MSVIEALRSQHEKFSAIRQDIHAHPELAYEEHRTAALVASHLEALGFEVARGIGKTGVVGTVRGTAGTSTRAIGLRADMDALPMQERNDFAYRSTHEGRMHACGHDGHTTMLLAAADMLAVNRESFDGLVHLIFQPAEEGLAGAEAMMRDGLFERFPMESIYGIHNWPGLETGHFAIHDGAVMACADRFDIEVLGHGAHAAMPHLGTDPVVAATALVQAIQSIVSRTLDPFDAAVVSTTVMQGGEAYNVISDRARLTGTVRTLNETVQAQVRTRLEEICRGIGLAYGVQIELDYTPGYPPTVNTRNEAALCAEVAASVVGQERVHTDWRPSMGAEDFAYFLREKPGCYVWLGNGPSAGGCMLHNPNYDFNDELIPVGGAYWVELVRRLLRATSA